MPAIETRMLPPNYVEAELEDLLLRAQSNPEITKQLAAVRYYLQDVIEFCQRGWKDMITNLAPAVQVPAGPPLSGKKAKVVKPRRRIRN